MCTNPSKGFFVGIKDNGKKDIVITNFNIHHLELNYKGQWIKVEDSTINPNCLEVRSDYIEIPCGKCLECQKNYRSQWALRIIAELKSYDKSCFVTLTYDDEFLPKASRNINPISGELEEGESPINSLNKSDLVRFINSLRKHLARLKEPHIRFFACGEYGSLSNRPHYHIIIFGYEPDDLEKHSKTSSGEWIYESKTLNNIWKKGFVSVGSVTAESAAYVAGYATKKLEKDMSHYYEDYGITPEFITMSKNGIYKGIGYRYFEKHYDNMFESNLIHIGDSSGIHYSSMPRYFKKLYEEKEPDKFKEFTDKNIESVLNNKELMKKNSILTYKEQLKNREISNLARKKLIKERSL